MICEDDYKLVGGWEKVVEAFGLWPSFHDGEVHPLLLKRATTYSAFPSYAELTIHTWRSYKETDAHGHFRTDKHHLVTFRLDDLFELRIDGFRMQNQINELV